MSDNVIFEHKLEQSGSFHLVCDAYAPWQNGRAERHGQWVKNLLEIADAADFIEIIDELETLAHDIVTAKNGYLHRGGSSPFQLVFGQNLRLPHELLSDDPTDYVGVRDVHEAPLDLDSVAAEFARELSTGESMLLESKGPHRLIVRCLRVICFFNLNIVKHILKKKSLHSSKSS